MSGYLKHISATREGQRIDNYLFTQLKGVPKGLIYRLLRTGKIRVNGKRVKQTYRLQLNDEIKIPEIRSSQHLPVKISEKIKQQVNESIIFESEEIIAINKPSGLAVHPGSKISYGVIEVMRALRPDAEFLELVHRLDRETSGCLLVAKNKTILNELHGLLKTSAIEKKYVLLVKGEWNLGEKVVDAPLQSKGQNDDVDDGKNRIKDAYTTFQPLEYYNDFTLLNAQIETGRTHQIRIHAAHLGFPIAGDSKHGDFAFNRTCKKMGLKRMFLHASELAFQLESTPKRINIQAQIDNELKRFIEGLDSRKGDLPN